jgi:orotate phosphoribosyltransferase
MVRESRKPHGRTGWVDGYLPGPRDRVALVDDVYTSGTGMRHLGRIIRTTRARVVGRLVVVDRSAHGARGIRSLLTLDTLI